MLKINGFTRIYNDLMAFERLKEAVINSLILSIRNTCQPLSIKRLLPRIIYCQFITRSEQLLLLKCPNNNYIWWEGDINTEYDSLKLPIGTNNGYFQPTEMVVNTKCDQIMRHPIKRKEKSDYGCFFRPNSFPGRNKTTW